MIFWARVVFRAAAVMVVCLLLVALAVVAWFIVLPLGIIALIFYGAIMKKALDDFLHTDIEEREKPP